MLVFTTFVKSLLLKYCKYFNYVDITKYSYFIITMSKINLLIYSSLNCWRYLSLLLMPSESYMEYREY